MAGVEETETKTAALVKLVICWLVLYLIIISLMLILNENLINSIMVFSNGFAHCGDLFRIYVMLLFFYLWMLQCCISSHNVSDVWKSLGSFYMNIIHFSWNELIHS